MHAPLSPWLHHFKRSIFEQWQICNSPGKPVSNEPRPPTPVRVGACKEYAANQRGGLVEEILSIPGGSLLNADLDDLTFFEKADSTASRGLSRDMTDVLALAGRVATVIFERAK